VESRSDSPAPFVSIVLAVYNRCALTEDFLRKALAIPYENFEIVVVDDGSADGTPDMVAREFPTVRLLREQGDLWWSKAMNVGVRDALTRKPAYILVMNDDVDFQPDFLQALVSHAKTHPRCLVGSIVYDLVDKSKLWYAGGKIRWWTGQTLARMNMQDGKLRWLTGMGTLIPAEVFGDIDFYDEKHFPQGSGDADFSMRAARAGYSLAIDPQSILYNKTDASVDAVTRIEATWSKFFAPLWSRRSYDQFSMRWNLYRRYWPWALIPVAVGVYYSLFTAKQFLRVLRARRNRRRLQ